MVVSAYVFEVQTAERNGSGLALAAKLVSGKLNIGMGKEAGFDNFVRFNLGSLDALYELFRTDSRFHVVSSPRLRVKNGAKASFLVGSEVPVLGQVSYADNKPVQSIEYRSSGVILNVRPQIRQQGVDLTIDQQLSNFAKTETGVNNSPTLIKREVSTPGECGRWRYYPVRRFGGKQADRSGYRIFVFSKRGVYRCFGGE
ncbi:MAG: type II secretion system protein GspD [Candidatus Phlomobacter fragariae]